MKTDDLRDLTLSACQRLGGKLWPNGLGFDRWGWVYIYNERRERWSAHKHLKYATVYGEGNSPEEARAHAEPQPEGATP